MNKFYLFFIVSAQFIVQYSIISGIAIVFLFAYKIYFGIPTYNNIVIPMIIYGPMMMMIFAESAPRIMDDTKLRNQQQDSLPMQLLPISLKSKFLIILATVSLCCIIIILETLPIEMIASWVVQTYYPDKHINVGGTIESMIQNQVLPLCLAETGLGLLWGTLFRNQAFGLIPLSGCLFLNGFCFATKHTISATESGICVIFAIICVILSYQCFKRWQPANNGTFMI